MKISLNLDLTINEDDWTLNYGIEGADAIEDDVRSWVTNLLTEALRANGVEGIARA